MPLPVYPQYILPAVTMSDGSVLKTIINTDGDITYTRPATDTAYVEDVVYGSYTTGSIGNRMMDVAKLHKAFSDQDGDVCADTVKLTIRDSLAYTVQVDGSILSEDLYSSNGSLFDKIFSNEDPANPPIVWLSNIYQGVETPFFVGTVDVFQISRTHDMIGAEDTTFETQERTLEINIVDILARLKNRTLQNMLDDYDTEIRADTDDTVTRAYAGITPVGNSTSEIAAARYDATGLTMNDSWSGMRFLTIKNLCKYIAAECQSSIDPSFVIDASFDYYLGLFDNSDNVYALSSITFPEQLSIFTNYLFGKAIIDFPRYDYTVNTGTDFLTPTGFPGYTNGDAVVPSTTGSFPSPLAGQAYYVINTQSDGTFQLSLTPGGSAIDITTTGTGIQKLHRAFGDFAYTNAYDRTMPLAQFLQKLYYFFGTVFYTGFSDSSGDWLPTLENTGLRTKFGNIPSSFRLTSSKEEPQFVGNSAVIIQNENDDRQLLAGTDQSNAITITIPFRAHPWGVQVPNTNFTDNLVPQNYKLFDQKKPPYAQYECFKIEDDGKNFADGWQGSKYLFAKIADVGTPNYIYHNNSLLRSAIGNYPGYVNLAACTIKDFTVPLDTDDSFNTLQAPAIFWFQELVGNRIVLAREYDGIRGEDGLISSIRPGIETVLPIRTFTNGGNPRTFRAIETEQDLLNGGTAFKLKERPSDYATLPIPTLRYITSSTSDSSSGGSTSAQGTGGTGGTPTPADNPAYVGTKPKTDTRNDTTPENNVILAQRWYGSLGIPYVEIDVSGSSSYDPIDLVDANGVGNPASRLTGATTTYAISSISSPLDGRMVEIWNDGDQILILGNNSGSGTASERLDCGGNDVYLPPGGKVTFRYSEDVSLWILQNVFIPSNGVEDSQYELETTDNTVTTIASIPTNDDEVITVTYEVTGIQTAVDAVGGVGAVDDAGMVHHTAIYVNHSGTLTQIIDSGDFTAINTLNTFNVTSIISGGGSGTIIEFTVQAFNGGTVKFMMRVLSVIRTAI